MSLAPRQAEKLLKIIELAMNMLGQDHGPSRVPRHNEIPSTSPKAKDSGLKVGLAKPREKARRRSGAELIAFRKMLLDEREQGASVADIARRHGISTAYIYQLQSNQNVPPAPGAKSKGGGRRRKTAGRR